MKPSRVLPLILAGAAACAAVGQQAAPPPPDEDDVPEVEEEWDFTKGRGHDLTLLDRLVPEGQSHRGLRYPVYSEPKDGKASVLQSQFEGKVVTRLDATHLQFKAAVVSFFGDVRFPDIATRMMTLVDAYYDLRHDILFSNSPVQILNRDLTIRSGAVLHDPISGMTAFDKGVKLYLNKPASVPASAPAPKAPPTPLPGH
jgi:hypothetical protein